MMNPGMQNAFSQFKPPGMMSSPGGGYQWEGGREGPTAEDVEMFRRIIEYMKLMQQGRGFTDRMSGGGMAEGFGRQGGMM